MHVDKIRSILIKILLATLIATAVVAVGVILLGSVTDLLWRVIWTFIAGVIYVGILLAILSTVPHIGEGPKSRSSLFVVNSLLALTCASYLTSILSVWTVISGDLPWRIHLAFIVLLGGILYAKPLIDLEQVYQKIKPYIYANYAFIAAACILTSIAIVAPGEWNLWNSFFGRTIAAVVVVCVTLSMVITVLYHLYLQQHPEIRSKHATLPVTDMDGQPLQQVAPQTHSMHPLAIVAIVIGSLFLLPTVFGILGFVISLFFGGAGYWD